MTGTSWKKLMIQEEKELAKYKRNFKEKQLPSNLKGRKREEWITNAYIVFEGESLIISGGARILLALTSKDWGEELLDKEKKRRYEQHLEIRKFLFRQDILGIDLSDYKGKMDLVDEKS